MFRRLLPIACCLLPLIVCGSVAEGDLIRLKSGGEIRGRVDREKPSESDGTVTITTLLGARITIARDDYEFITYRSLTIEEYESKAKRVENTVDAHWELAEWARGKGLRSQRETHLEAIIELDPDHQQAHLGLGHTRHNGEWISRDALMESQGYVKHKGRWITQQQLELVQKSEAEREAEREWYSRVRLWARWLVGNSPTKQQEAIGHFKTLTDPNAVPALEKSFKKHANANMRLLYLNVLGNIGGPKPVEPLVWQMLYDNNAELRYEALKKLSPEQNAVAVVPLVKGLRSEYNAVVVRAADALQHIGDERAIAPLIEALVTTHRYRVLVDDTGNTYSMTNAGGGGFAGGALALPPEIAVGLQTGQYPFGVRIDNSMMPKARKKTVTVSYTHRNEPVLVALQKLTRENFGYDERTWRLWFAAEKNSL